MPPQHEDTTTASWRTVRQLQQRVHRGYSSGGDVRAHFLTLYRLQCEDLVSKQIQFFFKTLRFTVLPQLGSEFTKNKL